MQRLKGERGAVAVIVALLVIPLIGFAAIAVDVGAAHADKQQLQIGADAAALAIAQDCSNGVAACGTATSRDATADVLARGNKNDAQADAAVTLPTPGTVTVRTNSTRSHFFAPIVGIDSSEIAAQATAVYGITGGAETLPLIFSVCEIDKLASSGGVGYTVDPVTGQYQFTGTSDPVTIYLDHPSSDAGPHDFGCTPEGAPEVDGELLEMPGGFSWITGVTGADGCSVYTTLGDPVANNPGNPGPTECDAAYLSGLIGKTIPLTVFNFSEGGGAPGTYTVYGYAGFTIEGFWLQIQGGTTVKLGDSSGCNNGNGQCIKGRFTTVTDLTGPVTTDPDAASLGAMSVHLTE